MSFLQRRRGLLPYLLLAPGPRCGCVFFFAGAALLHGAAVSLEEGTIFTGYEFTWNFQTYTDAISQLRRAAVRSFVYAGAATADRAR